jgi:hypothetical protein
MHAPKEMLNKSFDRLRTKGKWLIPFVVSLSNHALLNDNLSRRHETP